MRIGYNCNKKSVMLLVKINTRKPTRMRISVRDSKKPNTFYTNRKCEVNGEKTYYLRLPQSPDLAIVDIFNERVGNVPEGQDKSFTCTLLEKPLKSSLNVFRSRNRNLLSFVKFAQEFSERAAILSAGDSIYRSDDGRFRIDYMDVIRSRKDNQPLRTPARISQKDGVIQISKFHFKKYTVPMRMAILLHEFSHFYLNYKPENEMEADKNALIVYLSMGYPRIEAIQAFSEVFIGTPTDQNRQRWDEIRKFIDEFEDKKYKLY